MNDDPTKGLQQLQIEQKLRDHSVSVNVRV